VKTEDTGHEFIREIEFTAPEYGRIQQRLLLFKPAVVSRRESLFLTAARRKHPIVLGSHSYAETVTINLPAQFTVDDLPPPVKKEIAFGKYSANWEVKGSQLVFTRGLDLRRSKIPAEQYALVRGFFETIRAADQTFVALERK
jgi:hypothetical protein